MPNDAYKYFRIEARELLEALTQGLLELEKGHFSKDLAGRLLRYAHTLKGAARIVNEMRISEMSHKIEDMLSPYRAAGSATISSQHMSDLFGLTDAIAEALTSLGQPPPEAETNEKPREGMPSAEEGFETVRIEIEQMDAFLNRVAQTAVYETGLKQEIDGLDSVLHKARALAEQSGEFLKSKGRSPGSASLARELYFDLGRLRERLVASNRFSPPLA